MEVVAVDQWPSQQSRDYRRDLETGNIVFFPRTPFEFPTEAKEFLRSLAFSGRAIHKNIAYKTDSDRVTGFDAAPADADKLHGIMRQYARNVIGFVKELLPEYAAKWRIDYASFRPVEEQGR